MDKATENEVLMQVFSTLDEAQRRWFAAREAMLRGHGGIKAICDITDLSKPTVIKGIKELKSRASLLMEDRIRRPGGGRKKIIDETPEIKEALAAIMKEATAGDPMSLLRWTYKSTYTIRDQLQKLGFTISEDTVQRLLKDMKYSLQTNAKMKEGGKNNADRDKQFRLINETAKQFVHSGDPVISVDAKKREQIGNFKNSGRSWRPKGTPHEVNVYDFFYLAEGKATLYGAFDPEKNRGMVNVGLSRETAEYAVESIRRWWRYIGFRQYPNAKRLLICADGGGSNGSRSRLWKFQLQQLADRIGLPISVCHYPPGTSKWNKIEHRMFSFISMNWKGEPLVSFETVIGLISGTKTKTGLRVKALMDKNTYKTGIKISDEEMAEINIKYHRSLPLWNYTIRSNIKSQNTFEK